MHANAYTITTCRGDDANGCRFALDLPSLSVHLSHVVERTGWPAFLREYIAGPVPRHNQLRLAVAACPNGCSKPVIADIGIVRACAPVCHTDLCTQCGICEKVCPDRAIQVRIEGLVFDSSKCVQCGICVEKCREKALVCGERGYRLFLGGKLGRHPRLATEVGDIVPEDVLLQRVEIAIRWFMTNYVRGLRFGSLMEERGHELLTEFASRSSTAEKSFSTSGGYSALP